MIIALLKILFPSYFAFTHKKYYANCPKLQSFPDLCVLADIVQTSLNHDRLRTFGVSFQTCQGGQPKSGACGKQASSQGTNVQVEGSKALSVLLTYGAHRSNLKLHTRGDRSTPIFNRNTDLEERGTSSGSGCASKLMIACFSFVLRF